VPYVDKVKSVKKHGGFPTEVSDMARNMKMDQSKNCGHRIHVLFMMYDVYWYCQMKKKRMIMKILKKEWFIWKFWKKGGGGNEIHAPCACGFNMCNNIFVIFLSRVIELDKMQLK
jgi:hypothetical protein